MGGICPDRQTSRLLSEAGFAHAFFTRRGGVSGGPYASLNFSISVGDTPENVGRNLASAAEALGVEAGRIYFMSQVHGDRTYVLDGNEQPSEVLLEQGDAIVATDPTLACAVRTADCVPLLLADAKSGAVAAVHAGWRGLVSGVIASAVLALRTHSGRDPELIAAIGPHISLAAFEVSEDVAEALERAAPGLPVVNRLEPKPHVDLRLIARAQLSAEGVSTEHIEDVVGCTFGDPERYFSFRRDGARSGRHLHAIVPRRP